MCNIWKTKTYGVKRNLDLSLKFRVISELNLNVGCKKKGRWAEDFKEKKILRHIFLKCRK